MSDELSVDSPFHAGEHAVQERLGVREQIEPWARKVVRSFMPDAHRSFYSQLPFVVAAARDETGRPWATILAGAPGFIRSPDAETLLIEAEPVPGDALHGTFSSGAEVGLLGIELATRRRNRVNGRVRSKGQGAVIFSVDQSFGNCPQYISEREWRSVQGDGSAATSRRNNHLTDDLARRIRAADTFFIATGHPGNGEDVRFGMDASHRGGPPGFVNVASDRTLIIPDYKGNNHFNTIGNLVVDPRAGLLFVDFETGALLQMTGRAEIDWDSEELEDYPGARRLIRFTMEEANLLEGAMPLRWHVAGDSVCELRLVEKIRESANVTSFYFEHEAGRRLADFSAGQHLPIEVELSDRDERAKRTYSLSNGPGDLRYRISVKREPQGRVSRHLHDSLEVGSIVTARAPAGDFVLDHGRRPVVLVSAGIGVTPMVSMLHHLSVNSRTRSVYFVHGARDGAHHALADEVALLVEENDNFHKHISYSRPGADDRQGHDFDARGRVDGALLVSLLPDLEAEFYLCGPVAFMAAVQTDLESLGVQTVQIHSESFGPA